MRVYFLAETPCALTINGAYMGLVDGFERFVELSPQDEPYCVLTATGKLPLRFTLNEQFLFAPPEQITLYYTEKGVAIYASDFICDNPTLQVLWQERVGDTLFTLFRQGKLQLSMENGRGFHLLPLPNAFEQSTLSSFQSHFLLECEEGFYLFDSEGNSIISSQGRVVEKGDTLKAEVPFHDALRHVGLCEWKDGRLERCSIRTENEPTPAMFALALFESVLIGADATGYLAPNLVEKALSLKEFLGEFSSVVLTGEENRVGLAYKKRKRVFEVRYFRVQVENGKVCNILPEE